MSYTEYIARNLDGLSVILVSIEIFTLCCFYWASLQLHVVLVYLYIS